MTRHLIWFPVVGVLLLSSCIGIRSDIRIREDGSGSLSLSYTVSRFIKNIDAGRSEKRLPLPVNEEEFRRAAESIEGLRLTDLDQTEDQENVHIQAELEFDSIGALNSLGRQGDLGISLETQGATGTFSQLIYAGQQEEISPESLEMIQTFFEGYDLVYSITAPAQVRRHTLGELDSEGRTVTYKTTVPDILQSTEPLVLEVAW